MEKGINSIYDRRTRLDFVFLICLNFLFLGVCFYFGVPFWVGFPWFLVSSFYLVYLGFKLYLKGERLKDEHSGS